MSDLPDRIEAEDNVAQIAAGLSKAQREAWKAAIWEGEYYVEPDMQPADMLLARDAGLLLYNGDWFVTTLGERLIEHLNRPSLWRRIGLAVRAHLLEMEQPK